jgi:hypothetical protein
MKELTFYRCGSCNGVVSPWDLKEIHQCPKCGGNKVRPSNLSFVEKVIQIWKHPKVWGWGE